MNEEQRPAAGEGALARVIQNVAAGIVVLQDGRIVYANAGAGKMLARDADTLVGTDPADLLSEAATIAKADKSAKSAA